MTETYRAIIPYESLDPLTIGASGDDEKVNRDQLELEIPSAQPARRDLPGRAGSRRDATEAARAALESARGRPALLGAARRSEEHRRHHRQPVPPHAAVEAVARRARRARGGRYHRRLRHLRERQGLPDVRIRHRAEDRAREPRPDGAARHPVLPERAAQRRDYTLRRRLLARHAGLAPQRGREERGQDHDRPGAVEPLGRRRRRQADPARRRLGRDDRVEPLRLRPVAADALRRLRGPDALGHRRGRDDVRPRLHDERPPRHPWTRDRLHLRLAPRRPPRGHRAVQRDLRVREPGRRAGPGRHRDLRRLRADRPPVLPHGLGLHVGGLVVRKGGDDHLLQPLARSLDGRRRLPGPRADGPDEAVHAADAGELRAASCGTSTPARFRCGRAASGCRSTRS